MPKVNLLPQAYRRTQVRRRHVRLGVALGAALLGTELFVGFILHTRAGRTRELLDDARTATAAARDVRKRTEGPKREFEQLAQQLALARRLRTRHNWSRLLAALGQAASSRVTLTAVATDPARWTAGLDADALQSTPAKAGAAGPSLLQGLTIRGMAGDYQELSKFVSTLQGAKVFASLSLREARRDKYLDQNVVSFELQCRW